VRDDAIGAIATIVFDVPLVDELHVVPLDPLDPLDPVLVAELGAPLTETETPPDATEEIEVPEGGADEEVVVSSAS